MREENLNLSLTFFQFLLQNLGGIGKFKSFLEMVALFHFKTTTVVWKKKTHIW